MDNSQGAILQRDKQAYTIVPRMPMGLVTPDILESIAMVARKHQIPIIRITSAQRMALVGINPESIDQIWQELGLTVGSAVEACVNYVQTCPGAAVCKFGVQDSLGFGGNTVATLRIADVIAEGLDTEQAIELTQRCFDYYQSNSKPKERSARFIERIKIEEFKRAVQP